MRPHALSSVRIWPVLILIHSFAPSGSAQPSPSLDELRARLASPRAIERSKAVRELPTHESDRGRVLPLVMAALADPESPVIQSSANWLLRYGPDPLDAEALAVVEAAVFRLDENPEPGYVGARPLLRLLERAGPTGIPSLCRVLDGTRRPIRIQAAGALARARHRDALEDITSLLADGTDREVLHAVASFESQGYAALARLLATGAQHAGVCAAALHHYGTIAIPALADILCADDSPSVRAAAATCLGFLAKRPFPRGGFRVPVTGPPVAGILVPLIRALEDPAANVRHAADAALRYAHKEQPFPDALDAAAVRALCDHGSSDVVRLLGRNLYAARILDEPMMRLLVEALGHERSEVREITEKALARRNITSPIVAMMLEREAVAGLAEKRAIARLLARSKDQRLPVRELLIRYLEDDDEALRASAAFSLRSVGADARFTDDLAQALDRLDSPSICDVLATLAEIGPDAAQAIPIVLAHTGHADAAVRRAALRAAATIGPDRGDTEECLLAALGDSECREASMQVLAGLGDRGLQLARQLALNKDSSLRALAWRELGRQSERATGLAQLASDALADEDPRVRSTAVRVAARSGQCRQVVRCLVDKDASVRRQAVTSLVGHDFSCLDALRELWSEFDRDEQLMLLEQVRRHDGAVRTLEPELAAIIDGDDFELQLLALTAIGELETADEATVEALIRHVAATETIPKRHRAAIEALAKLGGPKAIPTLEHELRNSVHWASQVQASAAFSDLGLAAVEPLVDILVEFAGTGEKMVGLIQRALQRIAHDCECFAVGEALARRLDDGVITPADVPVILGDASNYRIRLPLLRRLYRSSNPGVRMTSYAIRAGHPAEARELRPILIDNLSRAGEAEARSILAAMAMLRWTPDLRIALLDLVEDPRESVRIEALRTATSIAGGLRPPVSAYPFDRTASVQLQYWTPFTPNERMQLWEAVVEAAGDPSADVRIAAADCLASRVWPAGLAMTHLNELERDAEDAVYQAATRSIRHRERGVGSTR